jgi:hexulose-6-phosphate isomerase
MNSKVGFMQGRLSPVINGKIQEFPWNNWREEFNVAARLGFRLMEWTLDQCRLHENPLMTQKGQAEIMKLSRDFKIKIPSLTGDCFMQSPFWKLLGAEKKDRQNDLMLILDGCANVGISQIVIPLVDDGRIENNDQSKALLSFLHAKETAIIDRGIQIVFESDFGPDELKAFIGQFNPKVFGINYDIGNSAALGFDVDKEFAAYGDRILNVHVKDRMLKGTTVPLGNGNADFAKVFRQLAIIEYRGNYILQTARADNGNHSGVLSHYKTVVEKWVLDNGS